MGQATLPDHSALHQDALKEGYEKGDRLEVSGAPRFRYRGKHLYELKEIKMDSSDTFAAAPSKV